MWLYDEKECSHKGGCGGHGKEHQSPEVRGRERHALEEELGGLHQEAE